MSEVPAHEHCIFCPEGALEVLIERAAMPTGICALRCTRCGLVFLESRASEGERDPNEDTYWHDAQSEVYLDGGVEAEFREEFAQRLESLATLEKPGRVLDVGCGIGHFLQAASERGWEVEGLAISEGAARGAEARYGIPVQVGTLDVAPLDPGHYDVITLWDVIEHVRKPLESLRGANRALRAGGVLVMKTPNERSLFKWIGRAAHALLGASRSAFLVRLVYYVPHYFSYDRATLERLCSECGFEPVRWEWDDTPQEFAASKIHHVGSGAGWKRGLVVRLLPLVRVVAGALGMHNKMTVYARKVREV